MRLVYHKLVDNHMYTTSIKGTTDTEFDKLLQQVHLSELSAIDSRINERLDMLEELLGVISNPADDTLSISGTLWEVSRTVFHSWMLPLMGVEITLVDRAHHLSTYLNFSLIWTQFYSLLATGVWG